MDKLDQQPPGKRLPLKSRRRGERSAPPAQALAADIPLVDTATGSQLVQPFSEEGAYQPQLANGVAEQGGTDSPVSSRQQVPKVPARSSRQMDLDLEQLREQGFLIPDMTHSILAEEYRVIKRPLLNNAFGRSARKIDHGNLIAITSALPGEGKTFTSINLAMSVAMELDRTVLLVDADIGRPMLTVRLNFESELGLTDLLLDPGVDISDVLIRTNVSKLTVLPAGRRHHKATELLASDYMRSLATEFSERYPDRVVIFDSPPLLVTSQASVLARLVGQVALVVEAGRTPQHLVKEALGMLDSTEIVGLVLNKSSQDLGTNYYYSYRDYGERTAS